ncbi:MAG: DUF1045 domain-containing protein [Acetobacteraceae bacterium]|nr:DUF1045 domain-containing protein [Acetobacteraceae bacterium]
MAGRRAGRVTPEARVAVYYAPRPDDLLAVAGAAWLGRDAETDARVAGPAFPCLAAITGEASRYGFHATLKPPMRLATGRDWPGLCRASERLARTLAPFELPPLAVRNIGGFLALRETAPCPALQALADAAVETLDGFRAPPDEQELAGRRSGGLSPQQEAMLRRWGYPYVFSEWFFHMTLTSRLGEQQIAVWRARAEAHFAAALARPRRVQDLCLFTQAGPDRPFVVAARFPLGGPA